MHIGILLSLTAPRPGAAPAVGAPAIYVASSGNDSTGTGSSAQPYATLAKALSEVAPTGTIRLKTNLTLPNTASYAGVTLSKPGVTIESDVPGTRRTLNMSAMNSNSGAGGEGFRVTGAGTVLRDLRFTGYNPQFGGSPTDYNSGVNIRAINCIVEGCEFDAIAGRGLTIGEGGSAAGTLIRDCDAHHCSDPSSSSPYGNADGFQIYAASGQTGIVFERCRSWANSDDGWDLYFCDAPVTIRDCWAFSNGYRADGTTLAGDGTGFKVGGSGHNGAHVVERCLSTANAGAGYSTNDNTGAIFFDGCTALRSGASGNAYPAAFVADGASAATLRDCVAYGDYPNYLGGGTTQTYDSWTTPPGIGAAAPSWWGASALTVVGLDTARGAERALPLVNAARPATDSPLLTGGHAGGALGWTAVAFEGASVASSAWAYVGSSGAPAGSSSGNVTLADVSGAIAGDLMISVISCRGAAPLTVPAGWVEVAQQSNGDTGVDLPTNVAGIQLAYCVRGASAPALTWTRTGGDVARGVITAYRPASGTISLVASSSATEASATTTPATGSLTTDVAGCLIVAGFAGADNMPAAPTNLRALTDPNSGASSAELTSDPAGTWAMRRQGGTTSGADTAVLIGDAIKTTVGATGNITLTCGVSARHAMAAAAFKALPWGGASLDFSQPTNSQYLLLLEDI